MFRVLRVPGGPPSSGRLVAWLWRPELLVIAVLLVGGAILRPIAAFSPDPVVVAPQYARSAMTLYEVLPEPGYLVPVARRTPEDEVSPRNAVEQLLAGPIAGPDLAAPFAPGTELLDFRLDGGMASVRLSPAAFASADLATALDALLLTLTEFPAVSSASVQVGDTYLDVEGSTTAEPRRLTRPLINPETVAADGGGTVLYFAYEGEDRYLVPVTRSSATEAWEPASAMDALLAGPLPGSGLGSIVPKDVRVHSVTVDDGLATVDFSAELVYAYRLSKANAMFVRRAVMATLTDLPGIAAGLIEIDGSRLLLYTCVNVTQEFPQARPWAINDEFYLGTLPDTARATA